jgi:hypothetical protein
MIGVFLFISFEKEIRVHAPTRPTNYTPMIGVFLFISFEKEIRMLTPSRPTKKLPSAGSFKGVIQII